MSFLAWGGVVVLFVLVLFLFLLCFWTFSLLRIYLLSNSSRSVDRPCHELDSRSAIATKKRVASGACGVLLHAEDVLRAGVNLLTRNESRSPKRCRRVKMMSTLKPSAQANGFLASNALLSS